MVRNNDISGVRTRRWGPLVGLVVTTALSGSMTASAQRAVPNADTQPTHAEEVKRLLITDAMVIYGNAKPPFGPVDILIVDGLITYVGEMRPAERVRQQPDAVIDATGKYVMPGMVNTHMHWYESRDPDIPQPIQYERNLYLASGTTTARELGGNFERSKQWQVESDEHRIVAPRMIVYARPNLATHSTSDEIRTAVREAKQQQTDGLKISGLDRDQLEVLFDEAKRQGLPTTTHIGVEETTAEDYIELGVNSIEHFYGIPDAALDGIQRFPPDTNYKNEIDRFAPAGELCMQANPAKLEQVVESMVAKDVAWSPTLSIYEASRDVIRARNLPWFDDYLHPSMEAFWKPNLQNHGSYLIGWTNTHQVRWQHDYHTWMDALRRFGINGGLITTGDDAGYTYSLHGFGMIRELELQEEAGFHPLEVLKHATVNGATLLGMSDRLGKVRVGYTADVLVVNGNPLENLSVLNPYGTDINVNNRNVHGGGIEWTIKDGIPYHGPTLMNEVKEMVAAARAGRGRQTTASKQ